jgi:hypothetical protein
MSTVSGDCAPLTPCLGKIRTQATPMYICIKVIINTFQKIVPRLDGLIANSSAVLLLSNKNLPEKDQESLELILLLITSLECGSTEK